MLSRMWLDSCAGTALVRAQLIAVHEACLQKMHRCRFLGSHMHRLRGGILGQACTCALDCAYGCITCSRGDACAGQESSPVSLAPAVICPVMLATELNGTRGRAKDAVRVSWVLPADVCTPASLWDLVMGPFLPGCWASKPELKPTCTQPCVNPLSCMLEYARDTFSHQHAAGS